MTAPSTSERIEEWLAVAPHVAPDWLRASITDEVAATPQLRRRGIRTAGVLIPLAAVLALIAVLIGQVSDGPVGDPTVPTDGSSELLQRWPNQPDWFVQREPVPFCGESSTRAGDTSLTAESMDVSGRQCLLEAFRTGNRGEFVSVVEYPDRGPVMTVIRVMGPGRIEVITDLSRYSESGWVVEDCTNMDDPRVVRPSHEARISDALYDLEVFRVDPASCKVRAGPTS